MRSYVVLSKGIVDELGFFCNVPAVLDQVVELGFEVFAFEKGWDEGAEGIILADLYAIVNEIYCFFIELSGAVGIQKLQEYFFTCFCFEEILH